MLGRSWYRFSLRSLLVACAMCCAALAVGRWYYASYHLPNFIIRELTRMGCNYTSDGKTISEVSISLAVSLEDAECLNQVLRKMPRLRRVDALSRVRPVAALPPEMDAKLAIILRGVSLARIESDAIGPLSAEELATSSGMTSLFLHRKPSLTAVTLLLRVPTLGDVHIFSADEELIAELANAKHLRKVSLWKPDLTQLELLNELPFATIDLTVVQLTDADLKEIAKLKRPLNCFTIGTSSLSTAEGWQPFEAEGAQLRSVHFQRVVRWAYDGNLAALGRIKTLEKVTLSESLDGSLSLTDVAKLVQANKCVELHVGELTTAYATIRKLCPDARFAVGVSSITIVPPAR